MAEPVLGYWPVCYRKRTGIEICSVPKLFGIASLHNAGALAGFGEARPGFHPLRQARRRMDICAKMKFSPFHLGTNIQD
ncbi:MAG: hypothetical protein ACK5LJ_07360 [Paracoccus sp. (in: a-proteobacteria)]